MASTIPIYNALIDYIEDLSVDKDDPVSDDIIQAAELAKIKLLKYYHTTDNLAYTCATSQYNLFKY